MLSLKQPTTSVSRNMTLTFSLSFECRVDKRKPENKKKKTAHYSFKATFSTALLHSNLQGSQGRPPSKGTSAGLLQRRPHMFRLFIVIFISLIGLNRFTASSRRSALTDGEKQQSRETFPLFRLPL